MTELPELRTALADAAQRHYGRRPRRFGRSWRLLSPGIALVAVAALAIVAVVVVTGAPDREHTVSPPDQRPGGDRGRGLVLGSYPPVPDAAERFSGALRHAESVPPGAAAGREVRRAVSAYGQDLDRFVVRQATRAGTEVTLGIGDRAACLQDRTPSGGGSLGCGPAFSAVDPDRPIISWSGARDGFRVSGAMIDGVSDVVVHLADGSRVPVALEANLFSVKVEGALAELTYRKPDGSTRSVNLEEPPQPALRDANLPPAP
jgi:hypothetical protein